MSCTDEPVCGDQRKILNALKHADRSARELCDLLWAGRDDGGPESAMESVRVDIWRLRRKLARPWRIVSVRVYRLERAA